MLKRHILMPILGLLFAFLSLVVGVVIASAPWTPKLQATIIYLMQTQRLGLTLFGIGLFAIGVVLLSAFLADYRRDYLHMQMGSHEVSVDATLVKRYVDDYWTKRFPSEEIPCDVAIHSNQISICAEFPREREEYPEKELGEIEEELSQILEGTLGYKDCYHVALRFGDSTPRDICEPSI